MEAEEYRRFSAEVWGAMAPGWERWREHLVHALSPVRQWLVSELEARSRRHGARALGRPGRNGVHCRRGARRGRPPDLNGLLSGDGRARGAPGRRTRRANVEYRVVDAERIDLEADSVDGVLCQNGYMLMADRAAALCTRPAACCGPAGAWRWPCVGAPERNPWAAIGGMILVQRGHMPPPEPGAPGAFGVADEEHTRGLLESAGFSAIENEELQVTFAFGDVDEYLSWASDVAGPFAIVIRGLPDKERVAIREQLAEAFAPFRRQQRLRIARRLSQRRCALKTRYAWLYGTRRKRRSSSSGVSSGLRTLCIDSERGV